MRTASNGRRPKSGPATGAAHAGMTRRHRTERDEKISRPRTRGDDAPTVTLPPEEPELRSAQAGMTPCEGAC